MVKNTTKLTSLFPTPVWSGIVDDFETINPKLIKYIQKLRNENPKGFQKSNSLGWHSDNFNLNDEEPKAFLNGAKLIIKKAIDDMQWDLENLISRVTNMWSIINPKNSSNLRHIHPNCFLSSAYYIKAPKNCGNLIFHDPRSAATYRTAKTTKINELNNDEYTIIPQEGLLVLFPSYLHHSVGINGSNEDRIIISFNIDLIEKNKNLSEK